MPTYGYHCDRCGHEFEIFQSMSAAPLKKCPECQGPLRKLLYPVGVQFKGSGFYTTDYKNGSGSKAPSKPETSSPDSAPEVKADSKAETKVEAKPEKKAESTSGKE